MHRPPVYLVDTPGVMLPNVGSVEAGLQLALIGTLRDDLVGEELLADYLLYNLNQNEKYEYVDRFQLPGPSDDIYEVLPAVATRIGALLPGGEKNLEAAARHMLQKYRSGALGAFVLEAPPCSSV